MCIGDRHLENTEMRRERSQELTGSQRHYPPHIETSAYVRSWLHIEHGESRAQESIESQVVGHAQSQGIRKYHEDLLAKDIVGGTEDVPGEAKGDNLQCFSSHRLLRDTWF